MPLKQKVYKLRLGLHSIFQSVIRIAWRMPAIQLAWVQAFGYEIVNSKIDENLQFMLADKSPHNSSKLKTFHTCDP